MANQDFVLVDFGLVADVSAVTMTVDFHLIILRRLRAHAQTPVMMPIWRLAG
jgi:hypothetical protein